MNRREVIEALAERTGFTKRDVDFVLAEFADLVTAQVAGGEPVMLSGFVKFARVERAARVGRNPATGEQIKIKASKKVRVTPLKAFKDAVLAAPRGRRNAAGNKAVAKRPAAARR